MKTIRNIGMVTMLVIMCSLIAACSSDDEEDNSFDGKRITSIQVNGVKFNMIKVSGGTFYMGATSEQGNNYGSDERPIHQVTLSDYYIGETEVTQELWQAVMGSNPSKFSGSGKFPVETVSWDDCQEFIKKLNSMTGKRFRLPTEAEWEFAARGGNLSQGFVFSGSDRTGDVAWCEGCNNTYEGSQTTSVVGKCSPNELGLYDMSGNVGEWCQDWYGPYSGDAQKNPTGPSSGSTRVYRGGDWYIDWYCCRVSYRARLIPSGKNDQIGLRLAM